MSTAFSGAFLSLRETVLGQPRAAPDLGHCCAHSPKFTLPMQKGVSGSDPGDGGTEELQAISSYRET